MQVKFRFTPFDATRPALGQRLAECLENPALTRLDAIVAWAKRSGVLRLEKQLRSFRARGGHISMIVGIDEHGATREGLELVRELADQAWIFHDPHGGTFHPKVYVFRGEASAVAFVGSANLTRGGHYDNYEATVELELALPGDAQTVQQLDDWIELLRTEPELCLELSPELIARISAAGAARGESDRESRRDADRDVPQVLLPFGRAARPRVSAPALTTIVEPPPAGQAPTKGGAAAAAIKRALRVAGPTPAAISERWFKELDQSGAQQPPQAGTNVTGVLRLTQSGFEIDWRTYFRSQLFGPAAWRPRLVSGRPAEETTVAFEVTVDGRYAGVHSLRISHARHREAAQANVTTVLHWGSLMPLLRARDFTGYWVVLSRTTDNRYQLSIQKLRPS